MKKRYKKLGKNNIKNLQKEFNNIIDKSNISLDKILG